MSGQAAPWPEVELGQLSTKTTVGFVGSMSHLFRPAGVPLLRGTNVLPGELDLTRLRYISHETHRAWSKSALQPGDLVMVRVGYPGTTAVIPPSLGEANAASLVVVRPNQRLLNPSFAMQILNSPKGHAQIQSQLVGGAQQVFNTTLAAKYRVPVPPKREQDCIAGALHDVDCLIATLERLIAKKQSIKQGMMQQLLTGRTRLPGFDDEWTSTTLGELGAFLKGKGVKRDDVRAAGTPCIRYGELYSDFIDYTASPRSFVNRDVASTALPIRSGDLLFAGSGETRADIGMCVAYIGDVPAVAGGDIVVLRGDTFNPVYLATLANSPAVTEQKSRAGQGDAVVHISSRAIAAVSVSLPSRPEQDAIAEVLIDSDREIAVLRSRLQKARAIKTGMMQQLLTGRVRLPMEVES